MKLLNILFMSLVWIIPGSSFAQTISADSTGLPGDSFSLEGALDMFKKAHLRSCKNNIRYCKDEASGIGQSLSGNQR